MGAVRMACCKAWCLSTRRSVPSAFRSPEGRCRVDQLVSAHAPVLALSTMRNHRRSPVPQSLATFPFRTADKQSLSSIFDGPFTS